MLSTTSGFTLGLLLRLCLVFDEIVLAFGVHLPSFWIESLGRVSDVKWVESEEFVLATKSSFR